MYVATLSNCFFLSLSSQVSAIAHLSDDDVNRPNAAGDCALHLAAEHNRAATVESLLKHGASLEKKNGIGFTALQVAAIKCHRQCMEVNQRLMI